MSSNTITVKCPQCERVYISWHTPAVNLSDSSSSYEPTTACSQCGYRAKLNDLSDVDGVLQKT
ncbi:MAG: hypothetical protein WA947_18880 [Phormidesmis sp.]